MWRRYSWIPWVAGLILVMVLVGIALSHNLNPTQRWICQTDHRDGLQAPSYCG